MNNSKINGLFERFTNGVVGGLGFSFAVAVISVAYASIGSTWTTPSTLEVGVGSGLTASSWNGLLANFNNLEDRVTTLASSSIPTGLVVAFNGTTCPTGWIEYLPARGRFLRGIDPSGSTTVDPSGTRAPGNIQADDFKSHTHTTYAVSGPYKGEANWGGGVLAAGQSGASGGAETRPKNVAVLYCIKS